MLERLTIGCRHREQRQAHGSPAGSPGNFECGLDRDHTLGAEHECLRDGHELLVELAGKLHVTSLIGQNHGSDPVGDQMSGDTDGADSADGQQRQVELVGAGVVDQFAPRHHLLRAEQVALGVLVGHDLRMLRQPHQGVGGDRHSRAPRDVVEHHGQRGGVCDGAKVRLEAALRRLVVVGRDDKQPRDADLVGRARQLDRVVRVVGADAGDHMGPVTDSLDDRAEQSLLLLVRGGRRLTCGAVDDEAVVAEVDQLDGKRGRGLLVERAISVERSDHGGQHATERALRRQDNWHGSEVTLRSDFHVRGRRGRWPGTPRT